MKRFGILLASAFLGSMLAGCGGGGIQEGMATDIPPGGQPQSILDDMAAQSKNMQMLKYGEKKAIAKQSGQSKPEPEKKTGP